MRVTYMLGFVIFCSGPILKMIYIYVYKYTRFAPLPKINMHEVNYNTEGTNYNCLDVFEFG